VCSSDLARLLFTRSVSFVMRSWPHLSTDMMWSSCSSKLWFSNLLEKQKNYQLFVRLFNDTVVSAKAI
jgi:hypothetical protein